MKVYMIQSGNNGAVKIGKSNDVDKRLVELQVANPEKLYIRIVLPCKSEQNALYIEKRMHKRFKREHLRGEWFTSKVLVMIRGMSASDVEAELPKWMTDEQENIEQHFSSM